MEACAILPDVVRRLLFRHDEPPLGTMPVGWCLVALTIVGVTSALQQREATARGRGGSWREPEVPPAPHSLRTMAGGAWQYTPHTMAAVPMHAWQVLASWAQLRPAWLLTQRLRGARAAAPLGEGIEEVEGRAIEASIGLAVLFRCVPLAMLQACSWWASLESDGQVEVTSLQAVSASHRQRPGAHTGFGGSVGPGDSGHELHIRDAATSVRPRAGATQQTEHHPATPAYHLGATACARRACVPAWLTQVKITRAPRPAPTDFFGARGVGWWARRQGCPP